MTIRMIGFDTAKHVFQVHGADRVAKPFFESDFGAVKWKISSERLRPVLWEWKRRAGHTIGRESLGVLATKFG
jgi:hypothetical protein